jgi:hypothetical protein
MSKLKSIKSFQKEALKTEELLNTQGGIGGPVSEISTDSRWRNTMDTWNCTDTENRLDTDWNGKWTYGVWKTTCQENTHSIQPCY